MITESKSEESGRKIEPMAGADIQAVMKIERDSFDSPWKKSGSFMRHVEKGTAFVVRTNRNVVVGYILIEQKGDTIKLCKMAVAPNYRHNGFGTYIIDWAQKEFAKDQAASRLLLHVRASNCPAISLYKKAGFEEIGRMGDYYRKPGLHPEEKAAIEMQWLLR